MNNVKIKMLNTKRLSLLLIIIIPLLLLSISCVNAIEIIDSFNTTNDIVIDGKWTTIEEWNHSSEESLIFGKGTGTAYLRLLNNADNLYVLVDFITYNDTKTGDSCMIVIDTKNDGGSSAKSDDLAIAIRWNTPSEIYPMMQWGGWEGNWEPISTDFELESSKDVENNPYSTNPHLIFEFKIPRDYFESEITNLGFIAFIFADNENILAALPLLQFSHQPDDWNDLILFNESIEIFKDAEAALVAASDAIKNAEIDGRTKGLTNAKSLINQAEDSMELHDYNNVISQANQAVAAANTATMPTEPTEKDNGTPGFELMLIIIAISFIILLKRRN
jgi:hypothetical protein